MVKANNMECIEEDISLKDHIEILSATIKLLKAQLIRNYLNSI